MIHKRLTETALAVCLVMSAGVAQAVVQDIAVNGGFETGDFSGWAQFPGSLGAAGQTITSPGNASTYAANLNEPAAAASIIKQANLLPGAWTEGQQIDVQFDIRGTALAGGVFFAEAFSEIDGGGVSKAEILGGGPLFPNADPSIWTTYNFSFTAGPDTSGGITLQLASICGADEGCIADYFIDNVSITADVSAIPIPAAAWLFGSGLISLFGIARKKRAT